MDVKKLRIYFSSIFKKLISTILGKVVSGWRVQNMSHWDLIGKRDPQKPQMFYPVADEKVTLKPGDVVAARCTMVKISKSYELNYLITSRNYIVGKTIDLFYILHIQVNHRKRVTWIGATNNDEMCNFYIMYWVYGKQQVHPNICFSAGPPEWSWHESAGLRNIPEKAASTLELN